YQSTYAEKIPVLGRLVGSFGRGYTGNANLDRVGVFKAILEGAPKNKGFRLQRGGRLGIERRPKPYMVTDSLIKDAGMLADWSTGRLDWGHRTAEMLTNTFLFAPKLFKTRLQALNILPGKHGFYFNPNIHPYVRKQAAKAIVRMVAA